MSRGQQGIGISAAGMYGQLTTGSSTKILSKIKGGKTAHRMDVQIDTRANKPTVLAEEDVEWLPTFVPVTEGKAGKPIEYKHGTCVTIDMEAAYVRGRLSADEFLKQCAIVNPHLQLHYRLALMKKEEPSKADEKKPRKITGPEFEEMRTTYFRAVNKLPEPPSEIKPHPHGVELGILMQMLKDSPARTLSGALSTDFSRVSDKSAREICERAKLNPKANPTRIAHQESEALYKAIEETKLMRPPTDCLSPIGEQAIIAGLKKEIVADFYTATTREPEVYRGNPFQIEVGIAYAKPDPKQEIGAEETARVMRYANRVPLLYQAGACAVSDAVSGVNWKAYGLAQPKGGIPLGPVVILVHMASVWVPFTSESKEAIAHYAEIIKEMTFALQECGRQLSVYLSRRRREAEAARKRNYIELYIPHLALGLKEILDLDDRQEKSIINKLSKMLEKTHLDL
jgi:DNA topoisomerase-6 subunit B